MSAITIRPAAVADLPAITAIYADAVNTGTATFELEAPALAEMTARFEGLVAEGFPYFVAVDEGRIAGYAYAGSYRARPAYRFTVENSIYLDANARRRGIGIALLNELVADSGRRGFRQMIAVIGDSANAASIAVHARAGFTMVGTFRDVGFKFGRWLDTVMMQRALS